MIPQIHWWIKRNEGMCNNMLARASSIGAKQVGVTIGANHRQIMHYIFKKMPDVRVISVN
jgi:hypothetical protein